MIFDAWHLPGLPAEAAEFETHQIGEMTVRVPALTPAQLARVLSAITDARARVLARTSASEIVRAIDAVARILASPASPSGKTARELLPLATGYSSQTVEEVLAHMTQDWQKDSLDTLLLCELGDASILDGPVRSSHASGFVRAHGPRLAYHIFSGNVPGVAVTSIVRSLLVKAATLGKTASGEPILAALFARTLAGVAPDLADSLAVTYWPGGTAGLEEAALSAADTVIVYGGAETVRSVRERVPPHARLIVHGPKLSIGVVGRDATVAVAADIARATAAYDQQGCVSPHVIYAERGGQLEPIRLAEAIADAFADLARTLPRRKLNAAEALAIRALRTRAEFGAHPSAVFGPEDTSYTVIYEEDVTLSASCLNRTLFVKPVDSVDDVAAIIKPHHNVMQSVALAGISSQKTVGLAAALADCGVTRITSFAMLPWPPMWWHHDGRGPLLELLSFQDTNV